MLAQAAKASGDPQRSRQEARLQQELRGSSRSLASSPHSFWGYRRIWAYLRCAAQRPGNQQRMWRLMREHHLLGPPNMWLKAKRTPQGNNPKPTKPNEWWGIDMVKVLVEGVGWGSIVIVLDW